LKAKRSHLRCLAARTLGPLSLPLESAIRPFALHRVHLGGSSFWRGETLLPPVKTDGEPMLTHRLCR
jgi:hypothetical protein